MILTIMLFIVTGLSIGVGFKLYNDKIKSISMSPDNITIDFKLKRKIEQINVT